MRLCGNGASPHLITTMMHRHLNTARGNDYYCRSMTSKLSWSLCMHLLTFTAQPIHEHSTHSSRLKRFFPTSCCFRWSVNVCRKSQCLFLCNIDYHKLKSPQHIRNHVSISIKWRSDRKRLIAVIMVVRFTAFYLFLVAFYAENPFVAGGLQVNRIVSYPYGLGADRWVK